MPSCVYSIENIENGKMYIGSTRSLKMRKQQHIRELKKGTHHNDLLMAEYLEFGADSFKFSILERVDDFDTMIYREQFWIDKYDFRKDLYNMSGATAGRPPLERPGNIRRLALFCTDAEWDEFLGLIPAEARERYDYLAKLSRKQDGQPNRDT